MAYCDGYIGEVGCLKYGQKDKINANKYGNESAEKDIHPALLSLRNI